MSASTRLLLILIMHSVSASFASVVSLSLSSRQDSWPALKIKAFDFQFFSLQHLAIRPIGSAYLPWTMSPWSHQTLQTLDSKGV